MKDFYVIQKWNQYIYIPCYNFKYSPFFGERRLYKIKVTLRAS